MGRIVLSALGIVVGTLGLIAGCSPAPLPENRAPTWEELPAPSWRIVARRDGKVLLAANRVIVRGRRVTVRGMRRSEPRRGDPERAAEYPTLIFENGRLRSGPVARSHQLVFGKGGTRDTLHLYSLDFQGLPVFFAKAGDVPAAPLESPTELGLYVVEHGNRLWLLADTGASLLTADTVQGIARDTLRSQTAEGGPYLYWASHPLWSPDGSLVAYLTNRTWMLARGSGQEVWLAEMRPRRERPLLSERGAFFYAVGWLGAEIVYTARKAGIIAVDARTGTRRTIGPGAPVAFSARGSRLLYMTVAGDTVRAHVLAERRIPDIPDPPAGERLDYAGSFSPTNDRLLLSTSFARDSGITRAMYVYDIPAKRLTQLVKWSFRAGNRHPQGLPAWLDDSTLLVTQLDRVTGLESSTLVRLPRPR
jgi:hypothetical protein